MKLPNFDDVGEHVWHIYLEGSCRKAALQDEMDEVHALDNHLGLLSCSMTCPTADSEYLEVQLEVGGLRNDTFIDELIKYLIDRYDMYECSVDLYAWKNIECTGWMFNVANYKYTQHAISDVVVRTCISADEAKMIMEDVKMLDWEKISTELITIRLQLEERRWGGRKEITSTKKFRGKPK